jgi:Rieske Fe-S protein
MTTPSTSTNDRRSFFVRAFFALTAALGGLVGGPLAAAILDPLRRRPKPAPTGSAQPIATVNDLPMSKPVKLDVISQRVDAWDRSDATVIGAVWLTRKPDGSVMALSAVCPHLGCSVGFDEARKVYACPCHASAFSVQDGARIFGPAPRGLDPLEAKVDSGKVLVTYKRFIQGISVRKEG